jgi:multidrug efflux pump subunit AcrB
LVDFISLQVAAGVEFREAVIRSAITRAQPIILTALAAMLGAFFILDDPIFNGLAISLIFGILVSTVLTLLVIPLLYFAAYRKTHSAPIIHDTNTTERILRGLGLKASTD